MTMHHAPCLLLWCQFDFQAVDFFIDTELAAEAAVIF
jgi:hypothetical protein